MAGNMEEHIETVTGEGRSSAGSPRSVRSAADPRRRRSREAILRAAQDLLQREQLSGAIVVEELIRLAGISKQTFYNHFPDREQFTREIVSITRARFNRLVDETLADEPDHARRLARTMAVYARQALTDPGRAGLVAALPLEDAMLAPDPESRIMRVIADGIAAGRLAAPSVSTGAALAVTTTRALMRRVMIERDAALAVAASQQFVMMILRAFGLPPLQAESVAAEAAERIVGRTPD